MTLTAFFVAAAVVTLLQWMRLRERRLLPLLAVFALLAMAHRQPDWFSARPYHLASGVAGLVLLVMLSPRHPVAR